MNHIRNMRAMGEFFSTAMIVLIGCLGCITTGSSPNSMLQTSLHNGLVVMMALHCFGFVSGAHANPCVSLAAWASSYITKKEAALYVLAQLLGAFFSYFMLSVLVPEQMVNSKPGLCVATPDTNLTTVQLMSIEFMLTGILVLGWCALWDSRCTPYLDSVAVRIGLLVTACCLAGGSLTGPSMNPVKILAPAYFHDNYEHAIEYIGSQLSAAIVVPFVWKQFFALPTVVVYEDKTTSNKDI